MKEIKVKGFTSLSPSSNGYKPYTLNIAVFGGEGAGKSRFIATAPDPVGGLVLDMKSEISLRRAQEEFGKQIVWPDAEVTKSLIFDKDIRELRKMTVDQFKEHYRRRVDLMVDLLMELCHHKDIRTVFVDPFYQMCSEIKLAVQGPKQLMKKIGDKVIQDNEPVHQEIIKVLNRINVKHTVLTHKPRDEYIDDRNTGRQTWQGFKYLGNHTNVAVELRRNEKIRNQDWKYELNVRNCLHNPTLQGVEGLGVESGLRDDAVSFEMLARTIFPGIEEEVMEREFL